MGITAGACCRTLLLVWMLWTKDVAQVSDGCCGTGKSCKGALLAVGGWVNRPVLRFQAVTHTSGSSFCRAFLEPPALGSPGSSGTQTESLSLSGAAGAACSRADVPAVRALSSLRTCSTFGGGAAGVAVLFALPCPAPRARAFRSCLGLLLQALS